MTSKTKTFSPRTEEKVNAALNAWMGADAQQEPTVKKVRHRHTLSRRTKVGKSSGSEGVQDDQDVPKLPILKSQGSVAFSEPRRGDSNKFDKVKKGFKTARMKSLGHISRVKKLGASRQAAINDVPSGKERKNSTGGSQIAGTSRGLVKLNVTPNCVPYLERLIETLCLVTGSDIRKSRGDIMSALNTSMLSDEPDPSGLLPSHARQALDSLITNTQTFLTKQHQLEKIVKVQSYARMFVVRRKYLSLSENDKVVIKNRSQLARELLQAERRYVHSLDNVDKEFLTNCRHSLSTAKPLLEIQEMAAIFSNIEIIANVHREFLKRLTVAVDDKWPYVDVIGKHFLEMAPGLKEYGVYVENFKTSVDTLARLSIGKSKRKEFAQFLDAKCDLLNKTPMSLSMGGGIQLLPNNNNKAESSSAAASSGGGAIKKSSSTGASLLRLASFGSASALHSGSHLSVPGNDTTQPLEVGHEGARYLKSMLRKPLEQINTYTQIMKSLHQATPIDHPDYRDLTDVVSLLNQTEEVLLKHLSKSSNKASILNVQRRLTGYEGPMNLLENHNRLYKYEGPLAGKRQGFLFSDIFILSKAVERDAFKITYSIKLEGCELVAPPSDDKNADRAFVLVGSGVAAAKLFEQRATASNTNLQQSSTSNAAAGDTDDANRLMVITKSAEDKHIWSKEISNCLEALQKDRVFGIPLEELVEREGKAPPTLLTKAIEYLSKESILQLEGLFRLSGQKESIDKWRKVVDSGTPYDFEKSESNPHNVTGLLKLYLRMLPMPLFPFDVYPPLLSTHQEHDSDSGSPSHVAQIQQIISEQVSDSHKKTLQVLFEFLNYVSTFSERNMMTTHNLSIVFAPNILRPEVENMESTLAQPTINDIVNLCIEKVHDIFGKTSEQNIIKSSSSKSSSKKSSKRRKSSHGRKKKKVSKSSSSKK